MTSKQRAYLRGVANKIDSIFQIGKGGITENLIKQLSDAIEARELIKITVLKNFTVGKDLNKVTECCAPCSFQLMSEY